MASISSWHRIESRFAAFGREERENSRHLALKEVKPGSHGSGPDLVASPNITPDSPVGVRRQEREAATGSNFGNSQGHWESSSPYINIYTDSPNKSPGASTDA